jgi:hypothetical protein
MRGQIAQVKGLFERESEGVVRGVEGLRTGNAASSEDVGLPSVSTLPVLPALAGLLPGGSLARGSVLAVEQPGLLGLALLAEASAAGSWCGVAGVPTLGVIAAAGMGAEPTRLMLVPEPGPSWPQVVASMLEACEVVLVRLPEPPSGQVRRRLEGTLRRSGGVLIAAGAWDGAPVRLRVTRRSWTGIGDGYGRLRGCRAEVVAEGRGAAVRPRRQWLWLPGPDGTVTVDETAAAARPAVPAWAAGGVDPQAEPALAGPAQLETALAGAAQ